MDDKPKQIAKPKQEGWYSFNGKGMRDPVIKAVAASALPDYLKAFIVVDIQSLKPDFNFIEVHFHRHEQGKSVIHLTVNASKVLVG